MDSPKQSYAAIKKAEIEKIIRLLKFEIGINEIDDGGRAYLNKLDRKARLKMIQILETKE
jgi:hypothetical protein